MRIGAGATLLLILGACQPDAEAAYARTRVTLNLQDVPSPMFFRHLEKATGYRIDVGECGEIPDDARVTLRVKNIGAGAALKLGEIQIFRGGH